MIWFYNEAAVDRVVAPILAFMMFWIQRGGIAGELVEEPSYETPEQVEGDANAG
jgi:hypothetical protein